MKKCIVFGVDVDGPNDDDGDDEDDDEDDDDDDDVRLPAERDGEFYQITVR